MNYGTKPRHPVKGGCKAPVTDWTLASIKPIRPGWYQVASTADGGGSQFINARGGVSEDWEPVWRLFDGKRWLWWDTHLQTLRPAAVSPKDVWRGLAEPLLRSTASASQESTDQSWFRHAQRTRNLPWG